MFDARKYSFFLSTIFGNPSLQSTHEFKAPKPCEVMQRFFANLNGSMKLLRSERPGISFFAKVVQLLALKCGTGLMFPAKIVVFIAQSGLKLYDFNIVDGEFKRTQNVVVPGSEAADGMWQKNMF